MTSGRVSFSETELHHELSETACTQRVITFIKQRRNPQLAPEFARLHNFTTGHCIPEKTIYDILDISQPGENNT